MKSKFGQVLLGIAFVLTAAALIMLLVHFWQLGGFLATLQPLARGSVAFFLGGAALYGVRDLKDSPAIVRHGTRIIVLLGLLFVYFVPIYCNFRHFRSDLAIASNPQAREAARSLSFMDYLHLVGTNQPTLVADDIPDGEGFFDILVMITMIIDRLVQKLFTNVLHLAVAGYVSLILWYLAFVFFSYAGDALLYDR